MDFQDSFFLEPPTSPESDKIGANGHEKVFYNARKYKSRVGKAGLDQTFSYSASF